MPAGAAIIGKVAVKVIPDTENFKRELKRDLDRIEKGLRVKVGIDLNESITKAAKAARDKAQDAMKDLKLRVDLDNEASVKRELEKIERELEKLRETEIKVDLDEASLRAAKQRLEERLDNIKAKVKVDVDTSQLRDLGSRLGGVTKTLARGGGLALGIGYLVGATLALTSNLAAVTAGLVSVSGAALALPGLLGGIAVGAAVTFAVFKDFNKVLPEVQGKLSALQDRMSEKFWAVAKEPIRDLINTLLPQLGAGLESTSTAIGGYFSSLATSLKTTFGGAFEGLFANLNSSIDIAKTGTDGLAGVILKLGQTGSEYLPRLAQWFVDITDRFNNFLGQAQADGRLKDWIDTGIAALGDLASAIGGLGGIFYGIGKAALDAGGAPLAGFADALNRIAATIQSPPFQTMLVGVFSAAHEMMSNIGNIAGPAVKDFFIALGGVLKEVLPIIGEGIGTALKTIAEALSQTSVQTAVITVFESIKRVIEALSPIIPPVVDAFAKLANEVFPVLATVIEEVAGALESVIKWLQENETTAKVLATMLGTTLVTAYAAMGTAATINAAKAVAAWLAVATGSSASAATQTRSGGQIIASWALQAARATAEAVKIVAAWVATHVKGAAVAAAQVAAYTAKLIALWVQQAVASAANAAKVVASWVLTATTAVASAAVHAAQVAAMVAKWVFLGTQSLLQGARVAAAWLLALGPIGIVIAAVVAAVALIIANWDTVVAVTKRAWDVIKGATSAAWDAIKSGIGAAVDFIVGLFLNFTVPGLVIKHWETIKNAFSSGARAVVDFVSGLPGQIAGVFSNAGSILADAGRRIIDGLIGGIKGAFGKVKDTLGMLTSMLPDWKGPAKRDKTLLTGAGQLIIKGFINGLESQYGQVRKSLSGLTRDVARTQFAAPSMALDPRSAGAMQRMVGEFSNGGTVINKTLNYHAAPGSSLGAEEDLFSAASRTRMVGW
jgi:phage-related protein